MPRRDDPHAEAQIAMPFLSAVEGASLEAAVARMQRQVEGLSATQLRLMVRDMKARKANHWMLDVATDALVQAVLCAPEEGEHLPDANGTYLDLTELYCAETKPILVAVHGARTRWGYMAKWGFHVHGKTPDGLYMPHPNVTYKAHPSANAAIAACLREVQDTLTNRGDFGGEPHMRIVAAAIGKVAELCALHAMRLPITAALPASKKQDKAAQPAAKRARKAA